MRNARPQARFSIGFQPPVPFGPGPGWYEATWYARQTALTKRPRSSIDFIVAVVTSAMRLPAEIKRVAARCPDKGD